MARLQPLTLYKCHAAGNDFIILYTPQIREELRGIGTSIAAPWEDLLEKEKRAHSALVANLCHRRFGIGADGILIVEPEGEEGATMRYFNSDGHIASFCGNGARAAAWIARMGEPGLGLLRPLDLLQTDGTPFFLECEVAEGEPSVRIQMPISGPLTPNRVNEGWLLNSGVPHLVIPTQDINAVNLVDVARPLRHKYDANIDIYQTDGDTLHIRTYERGVEDETLACGTGIVATAIAQRADNPNEPFTQPIVARGGKLLVEFNPSELLPYHLTGPVELPFTAHIDPTFALKPLK